MTLLGYPFNSNLLFYHLPAGVPANWPIHSGPKVMLTYSINDLLTQLSSTETGTGASPSAPKAQHGVTAGSGGGGGGGSDGGDEDDDEDEDSSRRRELLQAAAGWQVHNDGAVTITSLLTSRFVSKSSNCRMLAPHVQSAIEPQRAVAICAQGSGVRHNRSSM